MNLSLLDTLTSSFNGLKKVSFEEFASVFANFNLNEGIAFAIAEVLLSKGDVDRLELQSFQEVLDNLGEKKSASEYIQETKGNNNSVGKYGLGIKQLYWVGEYESVL